MTSRSTFIFPKPNEKGNAEPFTIKSQRLFILGANGSGKTRFSTQIETLNEPSHRIPAHKSLAMPNSVSSSHSLEVTKNLLISGYKEDTTHNKHLVRYGSKPNTFLVNDFDKLLNYLYEENSDCSIKYSNAVKAGIKNPILEKSKLDHLQQLWEELLPHRKFKPEEKTIQVKPTKGDIYYNASEMSDGERAIFYYIGQCVSAKKNSLIIVDEPENNLHKSIQIALWRGIEKLRPDCKFIYITHDIDFVMSMPPSDKIWVKSYDGFSWDWMTLPSSTDIPDNLLLELVGSRKPIIFVEGNSTSHDARLYSVLFPNYLIKSCGSCENVIAWVKAFRANKDAHLHHLDIFGIVDLDRRTSTEVSTLRTHGIFVLKVAEIENIFCVEELIRLKLKNKSSEVQEGKLDAIITKAIDRFKKHKETQIKDHIKAEVTFSLNRIFGSEKNIEQLKATFNEKLQCIDIDQLYNNKVSEFNTIIEDKDYSKLLQVFNQKGLYDVVASELDLKSEGWVDYICEDFPDDAKKALQPYFADFEIMREELESTTK